ncbi:MAG: VWA domain-containing protein [Chloroflexi bacterium]|nr:VWA domain-containing protein [Chloroflexota bacterium]
MKANCRFLLALLTVAALTLGTAVAGSNSTSLPNGAQLSVSIDDPLTGTEFLIPADDLDLDVDVSGGASVGLGDPDATLVYVMDVSGSTDVDSGAGCGLVLNCERVFVKALNLAAIADGSVDEVGLVVYADSGAAADMAPDVGDQLIIAPNADGQLVTVVDSTYSDVGGGNGGAAQYTNKPVGQFTSFAAGLQNALPIVQASTNGTNIVVFLSDGLSNVGGGSFGPALDALVAEEAVIYSIAVGPNSSCTGGGAGTLQQMADATGGTCTEVVDPGDLPNIIPDLISSSLDSLELAVDGGAKVAIVNDEIDPDLPLPGADSVTYATSAADLGPGAHTLCVTANGSDASGETGSVEQCETVYLFQISLSPATATNELGTPGQEHSVVATLLGDSAKVGDRSIAFEVVSGPNAGLTGSDTTDAAGEADFTYAAAQGLAGLGTDSIKACVTLADPTGDSGCDTATKLWQDTTPPAVSCVPTVNPHGKKAPPANNQDGFWELLATDAVDPNPQIYVTDSGSGTVFGPFASGTKIKYTEDATATPEIKEIGSAAGQAGAIAWHIIGNGDACVWAVDASGNVAPCVACLVPPPPM